MNILLESQQVEFKQLRVYDEKIVFGNGATLSQKVPMDKFKQYHISKPFNLIIVNMFYKVGFIESCGKGTNSNHG